MKINLPSELLTVIERLKSHGYKADVVGGAVRDFLRGEAPFDYDITTDATPDEMKRVFSGMRLIETGIKHGTLTVLVNSMPIEVTTYRIDGEYLDARHPNEVSFTKDLKEDLSRRDFTINAIAYNPDSGITDIYGGIEDLKAGVIRAVGDPTLRFTEDALRIMRALRFSSTLGFKIEKSTAEAIRKTAHLMTFVSVERILAEWQKLVTGRGVFEVIEEFCEPLRIVFPNLLSSASVMRRDAYFTADFKLQNLVHFSHLTGAEYSELMKRMHSDSHTRIFGERVLSSYMSLEPSSYTSVRHIASKLTLDVAEGALMLRYILGIDGDEPLSYLKMLKDSGDAYEISQLKISGDDLKSLGITGRAVGEWLSRLLYAVIDGVVVNERAALISFVAKDGKNS